MNKNIDKKGNDNLLFQKIAELIESGRKQVATVVNLTATSF